MTSPDDAEGMQNRLDDLGDTIDEARQHAEDDDVLIDPDEPKYHESGDIRPQDDDQTIVPPG